MYYIYKIENQINHKKYIGLTNNINRRKYRHFSDLRTHNHDNKFLQKEADIYGLDNFSFEVVFSGDVNYEEISEKEKYYIALYDSYKNGYNQNEGGNFGPSNGGTHLTEQDIYNILATLEFMTKPGQVLADIFEVSRTTISRIKRGENHSQYKEKYNSFSDEKRQEIFNTFAKDINLFERKAITSKINSKRQLTKEQVFMILANEEFGRILTVDDITILMGVKSSGTIYGILKHETYLDYIIEYNQLSESEKKQLASSLRKQ